MMPDVSILNVNLHGNKVGTLTYLGGEKTVFAFTEDYIDDPASRTSKGT
jgi:serine/threonine-protein kinase HipA